VTEAIRLAGGAIAERWPLAADRERPTPPTTWSIRDFASREVGTLSEQGGFDRARMLLGKGLSQAPEDPDLYVDAIRLERTAIRNGQVWQVWMSRALEAGVPIAERVFAIVPVEDLSELLRGQDLAWELLARQGPGAAAELLRLQLLALVRDAPARALDAIEDVALVRAAQADLRLQELVLGAVAASALHSPARVAQLMLRYAPAAGAADPHAVLRRQVQEIVEAARTASPAYEHPMPAPLDRALRLLGWCDARTDRLLADELGRDLRAQPEAHAICVDALALRSPRLAELLRARLEACAPAQPSLAQPSPTKDAHDFVIRAVQRIDSDPLRYLRAHGRLYRKHVRPALIAALAQERVSLPTFLTSVRATTSLPTRMRAVLEHADRDLGLLLLGQLAALT